MSTEEKFNQAAGAIKEGVGKLVGDKELESEGATEKVVSKVKEVAEDAKDAVEGVVEGVKNMLHKDDAK
ncbi:CsbD family protein [Streptococcus timonensis]|uniref:CsbD family protein n=1 Tax=Streptococcus timonensis TaxID=1852387 RepID=UPI0039C3A126